MGALEASRDTETGQDASRAAPVPEPTAERGARAAMVGQGTREAMAVQSAWAKAQGGPWPKVGALEASRDTETGQDASRAAPVPEPTAERAARAAMADPGSREAMADPGIRDAMAVQSAWAAMADPGSREAMADPGIRDAMAVQSAWAAMADPGSREAMAVPSA